MTLPSPFASKNPVSSIPTQNRQLQNKFQSKGNQFLQKPGPFQNPAQPPNQQRNFISFCKYCQEGFSNDTELFQHRRSHAKCPYDECKFNANEATIATHIQKVHLKQNGLVKIQDLSTPEQIEKWREERRKRYPTTQNVILRQQIQEERYKRGERLNDSKKRFSDGQQKDFVKNMGKRQHENQKNHNKKPNKIKKFHKRPENDNPEKPEVKDPVEEIKSQKTENIKHQTPPPIVMKPKETSSDEDETRLVPKFQGTSKMKDYHTVESSVKEKPALSLLGMYGSDSDEENSNGSDVEMKVDKESYANEALSSNIEDLNDSEPKIDCLAPSSQEQAKNSTSKNNDHLEDEGDQLDVDDNDSGPEELPTIKQTEADEPSTSINSHQRIRKRKHNNNKQEPRKVIRRSGLDYSKLRNRSINPFLEKLLERDIVHERNVLLQCVNFVVKNYFFEIGEKAEK